MLKRTALRAFHTFGVTSFLRAKKKSALTVLNLHRISPEKDIFFRPMPPAQFEALLGYVSKYYHITSFAGVKNLLREKRKPGRPYLVLSFDDGYYDFIEYALPLLRKFDLPCNHNIVNICANENAIIWTHRLNNIFTHAMENKLEAAWSLPDGKTYYLKAYGNDWIRLHYHVFISLLNTPWTTRIGWIQAMERKLSTNVESRMMNWDEIRECTRNKVEIGTHTYHHDVLSTITDHDKLVDEIKRSKDEIDRQLNIDTKVLALPNGQTNAAIESACATAGIADVLLVDEKLTPLQNISADKMNFFSRINIIEESNAEMYLRAEMFHSKFRKHG